MSGDPVSDVLNRAADRLEQPGVWAQGVDVCNAGRSCIALALNEVAGYTDTNPAYAYLAEFLGLPNAMRLIEWNDAPGRTAAEVVTALRQAAQLKGTE